MKKNEETKNYLKQRIPITCECKKRTSCEKNRIKYGVCGCDTYTMHYTFGLVIHNYIIQFLADAKSSIEMEDDYWKKLEECAISIRDYSLADTWDILSKEKGVKTLYLQKQKKFKESMKWLADNWNSLWW